MPRDKDGVQDLQDPRWPDTRGQRRMRGGRRDSAAQIAMIAGMCRNKGAAVRRLADGFGSPAVTDHRERVDDGRSRKRCNGGPQHGMKGDRENRHHARILPKTFSHALPGPCAANLA